MPTEEFVITREIGLIAMAIGTPYVIFVAYWFSTKMRGDDVPKTKTIENVGEVKSTVANGEEISLSDKVWAGFGILGLLGVAMVAGRCLGIWLITKVIGFSQSPADSFFKLSLFLGFTYLVITKTKKLAFAIFVIALLISIPQILNTCSLEGQRDPESSGWNRR